MSRDFELLQKVEQERDVTRGHSTPRTPSKLLVPAPQEDLRLAEARPRASAHHWEDDFLTSWWRVLRRRKRLVLTFFLTVVTLVTAASLLMTPKYDAEGSIAFSKEDTDELGLRDAGSSRPDDLDYASELDTQVRILSSDTLGETVIRTLHLDENPHFAGKDATIHPLSATNDEQSRRLMENLLSIYDDNLVVDKDKNTRIIKIDYTSPDPQLAAQVVNTLANAYIEHNFRTKYDATTQTSEWLAGQLTELQKKVESSQEALVQYQKEHGIIGGDDKQNVVTAALEDLNRDYTAAQTDRIQKEVAYRIAQSGDAELIQSDPDSLIGKLRAQQADLRSQYAKASAQLGPAHPQVIELNNQINENDAAIKAEIAKLQAKYKDQYEAAATREQLSRSALESQKQAATQLSEDAIQYNLLKRDVDSNRDLYESLLKRMKEASVTAGLKSNNIQIVDPARVPLKPSKPDVLKNVGLAIFFGLVGGIMLAFVMERFDRTLRTPEQVEMLGGMPALAMVPLSSSANGNVQALGVGAEPKEILAHSQPDSAVADAYRGLLDSIFLTSPTPPCSILVTSALPGEGKTVTSLNLAIALARQGKRVLLVDLDVRKPSEHKPSYLQGGLGLTGMLTNQVSEEDAILKSEYESTLSILPAGPADLSHAELVASATMQSLLTQWQRTYDHIVVDCPPVLGVSDAVRLSSLVDSVVLVVRADRTPREAFHRAQAALLRVKANLAGVVLNGVDIRSPEFSAQYGYARNYWNSQSKDS